MLQLLQDCVDKHVCCHAYNQFCCCLQLSNILWESSFAKDIGQTPEEAISLYMEDPSVDPTVKTKVPDPWDPATFISQKDLHSILEKVDWLSKQLG